MHSEILEKRCAEALLGYSQTMADAYTTEPEDFDAAVTALPTYILPTRGFNWHTKTIHCSLLHQDALQEETKN